MAFINLVIHTGHPFKAGHLFVCHSERSEESVLHREEIRTEALNDKKRMASLSRLKWVTFILNTLI